jgi:drug/metabolite transporter (DMT)-like permease
MKQRWVLIILLSLLCVVVFSQVAITLQVFSVRELPLNFVAAFLEAVITAVITVVLLTGQSATERLFRPLDDIFEGKIQRKDSGTSPSPWKVC